MALKRKRDLRSAAMLLQLHFLSVRFPFLSMVVVNACACYCGCRCGCYDVICCGIGVLLVLAVNEDNTGWQKVRAFPGMSIIVTVRLRQR